MKIETINREVSHPPRVAAKPTSNEAGKAAELPLNRPAQGDHVTLSHLSPLKEASSVGTVAQENKTVEKSSSSDHLSDKQYDYYINDNKNVAIKVVDKETGEVVREIPREEEQKLRARLQEVIESTV